MPSEVQQSVLSEYVDFLASQPTLEKIAVYQESGQLRQAIDDLIRANARQRLSDLENRELGELLNLSKMLFLISLTAQQKLGETNSNVLSDKMRQKIKWHQELDTIPSREAYIIRLRTGLMGSKSYSRHEIEQIVGVCHERIRQLETQGMNRLRESESPIYESLKDYLDRTAT